MNPVCKLFPAPVCDDTFDWFARDQDEEYIDDARDDASSTVSWTLEDKSSIIDYVADIAA